MIVLHELSLNLNKFFEQLFAFKLIKTITLYSFVGLIFYLQKYFTIWLKNTRRILIIFENEYILPSFISGHAYTQH